MGELGKKCLVRDYDDELSKLGLSEEQIKGVLGWVDTISIHIYGGDNIEAKVHNGVVKINEQLIDADDLSFNKLPEKVRLQYLADNGYFYNPFDLPDGVILYNPFTGDASKHVEGDKPIHNPEDLNGVKIMRNPFNSLITNKIEYKDGLPIKKWDVNEDNEWIEVELNN
jgi:hypothetical protein